MPRTNITIRVRSGRQRYGFDIQNVDITEQNHNISIRLPDIPPQEDHNTDVESESDAEEDHEHADTHTNGDQEDADFAQFLGQLLGSMNSDMMNPATNMDDDLPELVDIQTQNTHTHLQHHNRRQRVPLRRVPNPRDDIMDGRPRRVVNRQVPQRATQPRVTHQRATQPRGSHARVRRNATANAADTPVIVENPTFVNRVVETNPAPAVIQIVSDTEPANEPTVEPVTEPTVETKNEPTVETATENDADEDHEVTPENDADEDHEVTPENDADEDHDDHEQAFLDSLQRAIVQSMTGRPVAEEQKTDTIWNITTGDPQNPTPVMIRAGDPARPPIAFETLISGHPMIAEIRRTMSDSLMFYREIITSLDTWVRTAMNSANNEKAQFAKTLDKTLALYLLKFPRVLQDETFAKLIQYMEQGEATDTPVTRENDNKLKTILIAIKEGVLTDIVKIFDTPNCPCPRCVL